MEWPNELDAITVSDTAAAADDDDDAIGDEAWPETGRPFCTNLSQTDCLMPIMAKRLEMSVPIYGYISPPLILLTTLTNSLICVVLLRRGMRTATNLLLAAMALSDMLTGLCPLPCFVYFYTLGANRDWVPYSWCAAYYTLTDRLPTVVHTASIWLTVALAIHRYICVCKPQVKLVTYQGRTQELGARAPARQNTRALKWQARVRLIIILGFRMYKTRWP